MERMQPTSSNLPTSPARIAISPYVSGKIMGVCTVALIATGLLDKYVFKGFSWLVRVILFVAISVAWFLVGQRG